MHRVLIEAKDLNTYKKLLRTLGEYTDKFPSTGVDKYFKQALENGKKIMPKNKRALEIIDSVLRGSDSAPGAVQQFLNIRFADLPIEVRPLYKEGNRKVVAFWDKGGAVQDKVLGLIAWDGKSAGFWSDADGKKVTLLQDMDTENTGG